MSKCQDAYKEIKTFEYPGWIIRVHMPDLTEEERARRMKRIHDSAAELIKSAIDGRRGKYEAGH